MQTITRVFEFDSAHRIMNERVKCFNLHGHRFKLEVTVEYSEQKALGYALDFKEVKRMIGDWIDEYLDHACIINPDDRDLLEVCLRNNWKVYVMGMGDNDVNPSAENIASELLFISKQLLLDVSQNIKVSKVKLYETPNCWVETDECLYESEAVKRSIKNWKDSKGVMEYDIRNI